jgi:hypothetical protein
MDPADMLSPGVQATFGMRLNSRAKSRYADVILPQMVPGGLAMNNRARAGSSTVLETRRHSERRDIDRHQAGGGWTVRCRGSAENAC